jgi:hypothetical protein
MAKLPTAKVPRVLPFKLSLVTLLLAKFATQMLAPSKGYAERLVSYGKSVLDLSVQTQLADCVAAIVRYPHIGAIKRYTKWRASPGDGPKVRPIASPQLGHVVAYEIRYPEPMPT